MKIKVEKVCTLVAVNSRSYIPTVVDLDGDEKQYAPPNPSYTMAGTEKYVNSGWLLPKYRCCSFIGNEALIFTPGYVSCYLH